MRLYRWDTSYSTTIAQAPVASKTFHDFTDNQWLELGFAPQAPGEYLWVLDNPVETVGVWKHENSASSNTAYVNGAAVSGDFESRIGYVGTSYYYIRNAQGDIIGLFDSTGTQVVSYTYDTWGKLVSTTGSLAGTVGVENPYRYRGYRYDDETGLYYLQSRYYNPEWGRFINADDTDVLAIDQDSLIENNLFIYCLNNPVNMTDDDGHLAWFVAAAIGGALFDTATYMIGCAISGEKMTWSGVGKAALVGAIAGVAFGAAGKVATKVIKVAKTGTKIGKIGSKISRQSVDLAVSSTKRLQHAFKHASSFGFGNWNSTVAKQWACFIKGNLTFYTKTFSNKLGEDAVTGYYRYFNGQHIATYLYNSGPNKGLVASVVKLSENQMTKFGLW